MVQTVTTAFFFLFCASLAGAQVLPTAYGGTGSTNGLPSVSAVDMELFPGMWSICDGTCAGGPGGNLPSVGPTHTFNVGSPSLNNNASEMSFTANANTTDVLFVSKPTNAYSATVTHFIFDIWYYPTNSTGVDEHEFDEFTFTHLGSEWMFGHQCVVGGTWDIWNQFAGNWISTAYECTQLTVNTWHHLVFSDYRNASDTTGCSGYGCMYFGSLTVDGVLVYSLNQVEPAGPTPSGFASAAGAQVQEDVDTASVGSPVAVVSYYDLATFTEAQ